MQPSLKSALRPYLKETILGPTFKLFEAALELSLPIFLARIIDRGIAERDHSFIIHTGLIMLAVIFAGLINAIICQYFASVAAQGFGDRVRRDILKHVQSASISSQSRIGAESLIVRMTSDVNSLQLGVSMLIRLGSRIPFVIIGSVGATFIIDRTLALILLVGALIFALIMTIVIRNSFPLFDRVQDQLDHVGVIVKESVSGVRVIRSFGQKPRQRRKVFNAVDEHERAVKQVAKWSSIMSPVTQWVMNLSICVLLFTGALRIDAGLLTDGELVAVFNYVVQILSALVVVANLVVIFTRASVSKKRVEEIYALPMDDSPEGVLTLHEDLTEDGHIAESMTDGPCPASALRPGENRVIAASSAHDEVLAFEKVCFSYGALKNKDKATMTLSDIDFRISKGQVLGIVGTTGSGKSTVLALAAGLYRPSSGEIRIMGQDSSYLPVEQIRDSIGVVPQSPKLFAGSVADNLRFGNSEADNDLLKGAAKTAQAWEFIKQLPDHLESKVDTNGRNFSGGQKQRIAIARAIAKNSPILALDDAASALDRLTEFALYEALLEDVKLSKRTLVLVSSRIAAVVKADIILVLDDGAQVGLGTHEELFDCCAPYREMAESQHVERQVR
ncbi:MAG: ABC transporter ATP-binding protein [Clostridiaceae bacterium]|nr:ABC transporter ATP-binding protein [Clostridiaceae bacterium]